MRANPSCVVIFLSCVTVSAQSWTTVADLNEARGEHSNAVYDGKIYCMTGFQQVFSTKFHPEVFDPSTSTWSTLTVPSHVASGGVWSLNHVTAGNSVYGSEIWLCGGKYGASSYTSDVWVYDAADNTWRAGPSLPQITWGAPAVVIGDELHVLGGYKANSDASTYHFVLDLTHKSAGWSTEPALPERFGHMAAVALNGKIITVGGERDHAGHVGESGNVQVYDPSTNTWDLSWPDCPEARTHHEWATFVYNGEVWSVSGVDTDRSPIGQNTIHILNPSTKKWRRYSVDLPHHYVSPGAKVIDHTLYVFGGGYDNWWPAKTTTIALSLTGGTVPDPTHEVIDAFSTIEAETFTDQIGVGIYHDDTQIGNIQGGDWVKYAHVDFGTGASSVTVRAACDDAGGTVSFRLDGVDGTEVGSIAVTSTGGWTTYAELRANLTTTVTDTHDLYLMFIGSGQYLMDIDWLVFAEDGATRVLPSHTPSGSVDMVPVAGGVLLRSASPRVAARVTDLRGRSMTVPVVQGAGGAFAATGHLSPGSYLLDVRTREAERTVRVVVRP